MTELTGNAVLSAAEPEFVTAAVKDETSLTEAFENTLEISKDVELTECTASEETDSRDKQEDGGAVHPPAAESSSTEPKWVVGAQCRALWSEDGRVYPATVVSLDGERCRVRFNGYGNQEDVELSTLRRPDDAAAAPTQRQNSQDWKPGSRCRAVYSEDGLVYPAVVLWVKGQRCRVRFDDYNNEEEQDVAGLLNLDELRGPSRATTAKGSNWKTSGTSGTSSNLDWKRRREESQGERGRGERRSAWRDEEQNSSWGKERPGNQKEAEEKKRSNQHRDPAEKPTNHSFSFFPPFPPPPHQSASGDPVSFIPPPPPPLWTFAGGSAGADSSSSMLMLWYMCGFHTGSYLRGRSDYVHRRPDEKEEGDQKLCSDTTLLETRAVLLGPLEGREAPNNKAQQVFKSNGKD